RANTASPASVHHVLAGSSLDTAPSDVYALAAYSPYTYTAVSTGPDYFYIVTAVKLTGGNAGESIPSNAVATNSITPSPTSKDFGSVVSGTSAVQTFTVTNNISSAVSFKSVVVTGTNASEFVTSGLPASNPNVSSSG